jgi:hypothetical protein
LYGYAALINARFECNTAGCGNPDLATGTCGEFGKCEWTTTTETNVTTLTSQCVCSDFASGHFCEYEVSDEYVTKQFDMMYEYMRVSDNYTDFRSDIQLDFAVSNQFYERFWDHQIKVFSDCKN